MIIWLLVCGVFISFRKVFNFLSRVYSIGDDDDESVFLAQKEKSPDDKWTNNLQQQVNMISRWVYFDHRTIEYRLQIFAKSVYEMIWIFFTVIVFPPRTHPPCVAHQRTASSATKCKHTNSLWCFDNTFFIPLHFARLRRLRCLRCVRREYPDKIVIRKLFELGKIIVKISSLPHIWRLKHCAEKKEHKSVCGWSVFIRKIAPLIKKSSSLIDWFIFHNCDERARALPSSTWATHR